MLITILAASMNAANWILAQAETAPAPAPAPTPGNGAASPGGGGYGMLIMLAVIFAIFYFMMLRPQRKAQSQRKAMLDTIKKGDKVLTIGGAMGTIVSIKDNEVTIKVDEATNTRITFVRSAVDRVLSTREDSQGQP